MLAGASEWVPQLRTRSADIEANRQLPDDLAAELRQRALCRMLVPQCYGGLQAHPTEMTAVLHELARGDAAVGWCAMITATSGFFSAWLDAETAAQVRPGDDDVMFAGVAAPRGKVRLDDSSGDFLISGRWPFGSATRNADWILAGCRLAVADGEKPAARLALLPKSAVEFIDNWQVSGLCGTGSGDFATRGEVSCAPGLLIDLAGGQPVDGTLYRLPNLSVLAAGVAAVALGVARGALEHFGELAGGHQREGARRTLAMRSSVQGVVSRAEGRVRAARCWLDDRLHAMWDAAERGKVPFELRVEVRLAAREATQAAVAAVDSVYTQAGTAAIYDTSPLQRAFRDIHVITQHAMVSPPFDELLGRTLLGVETSPTFL